MGKIKEVIQRTKYFDKCWVTTNSFCPSEEWFNCIYLNFEKTPELEHLLPKEKNKYGFHYTSCQLASLEVHSYMSFYEETTVNGGKTYVKCGWDFQHLHDEHWGLKDNGLEIINQYADNLNQQFLKMVENENL